MVDDGPSFAEELVDAGNYEDADLVLAKQIAEIIKLAENTGLRVPIPDNARRFAERKLTESYCAETSSISHPPLPTESSIVISHLRCILRRYRACAMKI